MSINQVAISGNLGRDSELRRTQTGFSILSFSVAVNERKKNNQTGEWSDYTNWVGVSMFGTRAEKLHDYLKKGTKVCVQGKLRYSEWERDGAKKSKIEVIAYEIELMNKPQNQEANKPQNQEAIEVEATVYDDDIPF